MGAQINDLHRKLLIYKESENRVFRFPDSQKDHGRPFYGFISYNQNT